MKDYSFNQLITAFYWRLNNLNIITKTNYLSPFDSILFGVQTNFTYKQLFTNKVNFDFDKDLYNNTNALNNFILNWLNTVTNLVLQPNNASINDNELLLIFYAIYKKIYLLNPNFKLISNFITKRDAMNIIYLQEKKDKLQHEQQAGGHLTFFIGNNPLKFEKDASFDKIWLDLEAKMTNSVYKQLGNKHFEEIDLVLFLRKFKEQVWKVLNIKRHKR